jgi:hypothetical protein
MGAVETRTDAEVVEEVVLYVEVALELAREADRARSGLGSDAVKRLSDIHRNLLRDGLRMRPEGVLF